MIVPIATHQERLTGQTCVNTIMISASASETVAGVIDATERLLRLEHHLTPTLGDDFTIRNIANVQEVRMATASTQALLLAAVAVVSLVVGGIGIMNIMLVSVTERTREIGLRMAVGAQGRDILLQFLIEALRGLRRRLDRRRHGYRDLPPGLIGRRVAHRHLRLLDLPGLRLRGFYRGPLRLLPAPGRGARPHRRPALQNKEQAAVEEQL